MKKFNASFVSVSGWAGTLAAVTCAALACSEAAPPPLGGFGQTANSSSNSQPPPPPPPGGNQTVPGGFVPAPVTSNTTPAPVASPTTSAPVSTVPAGTVSGGTTVTPRPQPGAPTASVTATAAPPVTTTPQVPVTSVSPTPTATTPVAEPTPAGEGNLLKPNVDFWVGPGTNGVGVTGSWYGYQDAATTGCCEDLLTWEDGTVCMAGTTGQQADIEDFATFGAGMGFTFNAEDPWDGSAYSGVSFTAEVDSDAVVNLQIKMATTAVIDGGEHLVALSTGGSKTVTWASLAQPDWVAAADATAFDPSDIEAIQIQVKADTEGAHDFTVCISNLTVVE